MIAFLLYFHFFIAQAESLTMGEVENNILKLFQLEKIGIWNVLNSKRQVVPIGEQIKQAANEIFLQSPVISAHLQLTEIETAAGKDSKKEDEEKAWGLAIAFYDRELKTPITTRILRLDYQRPAIETLVSIEETINTLKYEILAKSSQLRAVASLNNLSQSINQQIRIILWGGVGILSLPLIARFNSQLLITQQGQINAAVWISALVVAGISLSLDPLTNNRVEGS